MKYFFLAKPDDVEYIIWEQADGHCWQVSINWTKGVMVVIDDYGIVKMKREGLSTQQLKFVKENFLEVIKCQK